jgi:plasmid stability protein
MAQFIVRNLEEDVKTRLKKRAARNGRSMEEEARHILRNAVKAENQAALRLGSRIAARFSRATLPGELPELRGQAPRAPDFRK